MFVMPALSLLLATTTQDMSARMKADAQDARQQLAVVSVKMGRTFKRIGQEAKEGGIAIGHTAKAGGITTGRAVKAAGQEIGQAVGQGAKRVGTGVKKRAKKVGQGVKEAFTP